MFDFCYFCRGKLQKGDSFIGYHEDTAATIVLQTIHKLNMDDEQEVNYLKALIATFSFHLRFNS